MSKIYFYEKINTENSLAPYLSEALSDRGALHMQDPNQHCGSTTFLAYIIVFHPDDSDHIGFIYSHDFDNKDSDICSYLKKFNEPDSIPFCPSHSSFANLHYTKQGVLLCPNSIINPYFGKKKSVVFIYTANHNREPLSAEVARALQNAGYKSHVHSRINSPDCADEYDYIIVTASPENGALFFYKSRPAEDRIFGNLQCPIYELQKKFHMPGGCLDESHTGEDSPVQIDNCDSIKEQLEPGSMRAKIYLIIHTFFTEKDGINTILVFEKLHQPVTKYERLRKYISTNIFSPLLRRNLLVQTSVRGVFRKTHDFTELCDSFAGKAGFIFPNNEAVFKTPPIDFSETLPVIPQLVDGSLRYDIYKSVRQSFSMTSLISSLAISNRLELDDYGEYRQAITRCLAEMKTLSLIEPVGIEGVYSKNAWCDAAIDLEAGISR